MHRAEQRVQRRGHVELLHVAGEVVPDLHLQHMVVDDVMPFNGGAKRRVWSGEQVVLLDRAKHALDGDVELLVRHDAVAVPVHSRKLEQVEAQLHADGGAVDRERGLALGKVVSGKDRRQAGDHEEEQQAFHTVTYFTGLPQLSRNLSKSANAITIVLVLSFG